jgi:hypothetical protein
MRFEGTGHSLTHSIKHSLFHSLTHSLTLTLTLSLTHSHSLTHSFTHSLTLFAHSLTHLLQLTTFCSIYGRAALAQACPHFYQNSLSPHCDADAGGWAGLVTSGACCGLSGKWFSMLMWFFLNHYSTEKNEIRREARAGKHELSTCRRFNLSCPGSLMTRPE